MSFLEILRSAVRGITANKLRSALTLLGVMIGVASVILLLAVGNGSAQRVQSAIANLWHQHTDCAGEPGRRNRDQLEHQDDHPRRW